MVIAQGLLLGGIKGLMPGVLRHLWHCTERIPRFLPRRRRAHAGVGWPRTHNTRITTPCPQRASPRRVASTPRLRRGLSSGAQSDFRTQAFNLVLGMNNLALCLAAAIGPATAWIAYVGSPDVTQSDLDSGRATGKDFEYWYYAAGVVQLIAAGVLVFPNMVPRFEPPPAAKASM